MDSSGGYGKLTIYGVWRFFGVFIPSSSRRLTLCFKRAKIISCKVIILDILERRGYIMTIKIEHISLLKDFYGALLTPKQAETLSLYYEDDWSLAEIAENTGRSRQAVFDILKRAEETLENYEQQLGFMDKYANNRQLLENIESLLNQNDFDKTALAAARKLVRELKTSI
jgi:predicted DNA-binding protein YlxM (UPF0122 family)